MTLFTFTLQLPNGELVDFPIAAVSLDIAFAYLDNTYPDVCDCTIRALSTEDCEDITLC